MAEDLDFRWKYLSKTNPLKGERVMRKDPTKPGWDEIDNQLMVIENSVRQSMHQIERLLEETKLIQTCVSNIEDWREEQK